MQFGNPISSLTVAPTAPTVSYQSTPQNPVLNIVSFIGITVPVGTRTLVCTLNNNGVTYTAGVGPVFQIIGATTGKSYYAAIPYLTNPGGGSSGGWTMIIPVDIADTTFNASVTSVNNVGNMVLTVYADFNADSETRYYNGQAVTSTNAVGAGAVLTTGPYRLLTLDVDVGAAQSTFIEIGGAGIARFDGANQAGTSVMQFPQPFIIPAGKQLTTSGAVTSAIATLAYP